MNSGEDMSPDFSCRVGGESESVLIASSVVARPVEDMSVR